MIRVVIADDHAMLREGLRSILSDVPTIRVISEACNGYEVMTQARAGGFDVLLLDLAMPGRCGVELIRQLMSEIPNICILVLTMHEAEHYAIPTMRAGARGFLHKSAAVENLVAAVHCVASGRPYVSSDVAQHLARHVAAPAVAHPHLSLSEREYAVFSGLAHGLSVTRIAQDMAISVKTVSTHKARLFDKMRVATVSELVQYAVEHRLLTTSTSTSASDLP